MKSVAALAALIGTCHITEAHVVPPARPASLAYPPAGPDTRPPAKGRPLSRSGTSPPRPTPAGPNHTRQLER
jgi:hypothetical protein